MSTSPHGLPPRGNLFRIAAAVLTFAAPHWLDAATQIIGSVRNEATGVYLQEAEVSIGDRRTHTDRAGVFEFPNLPAGTYTLKVSYAGLDAYTEQITVADESAKRVEVALTSSLYVMPTFNVSGEREGAAAAAMAQKRATNLQNVVTADTFGTLDRGSIQSFLERLPGVVSASDGVSVRGMGEEQTTVDIDGTRASSARSDRAQHLGSIPVDMIERAEVVKGTTAEMDADSLGGRINLVTKSAFDRKGRRIDLAASVTDIYDYGFGGTSSRYGDLGRSFNFGYSDVFSIFGKQNNLGVMLNLNSDQTTSVSHTMGTIFRNDAGNNASAGQPEYAHFEYWLFNVVDQKREGGNLRVDYKISDDHSISVSYVNSKYHDHFLRGRARFEGGRADVAQSDSNNFTTSLITGAVARGQQEPSTNITKKESFRIATKHRFGDWRVTADFVRDVADQHDERNILQTYSTKTFNYRYNRPEDELWPTIEIVSGQNPYTDDYSNTNRADVEMRHQFTKNVIIGSRLDAVREFHSKIPVTFKTGFRYRGEERSNRRDTLRGRLAASNLSQWLDKEWDLAGGFGRYPQYNLVSVHEVIKSANINYIGGQHANPADDWTWDSKVLNFRDTDTYSSALLDNFKISEDVTAGYTQASASFGRLNVLGGVRFERTESERIFPLRRRQASSPLEQYNTILRESSAYDDLFPSLHFRYQVSDNLIARLAFSTTIGRPNMEKLISAGDANINNRTLNITDGSVRPQYSNNFDFSLEYYFNTGGLFSVGVFHKDISDYIADFSETVSAARAAELGAPVTDTSASAPEWTITGTRNGGWARVNGIEIDYSQQFIFLPGKWRGFGVFANYTYLKTEGNFGQASTTAVLPRFVPRSFNAGVNYSYDRWDLRLLYNYRDSFLEDLNAVPALSKYRGDRGTLSFKGSFRFYKNYRLFVDASNLTGEELYKYRGSVTPQRLTEIISQPSAVTVGVRATF
jgi:iron complex outermembrane receptor protein